MSAQSGLPQQLAATQPDAGAVADAETPSRPRAGPFAGLPMAEVLLPMVQTAALIAAGQLGLFEALAEGPLPLDALAKKLSSSPRGVRDLAQLLATTGYLVRSGDTGNTGNTYANAPHTQRWFTSSGEVDYTPGLRWSGLSVASPLRCGAADPSGCSGT